MKSKVITILIGLMCCLCGCSMTMTPEERVALLYGGQNQEESIELEGVIHEPENNQATRLVVQMEAYDMEILGNVLLNLTPDQVQEKKYSDTTLYTYYDERMVNPMDSCGIRSNLSRLIFNSIPDVDCYTNAIGLAGRSFGDEFSFDEVSYNSSYSDIILKTVFRNEELNGVSISQTQTICEDILKKIGFEVSDIDGYVMDADSLNKIQMDQWNRYQFAIPSPGYARDEKGKLIGELPQWDKDDEAFLILCTVSYNGIPIEGIDAQSRIEMYYSEEKGVFFLESVIPHLTNIIQEESIPMLSGHEIVTMAIPILSNIGIDAQQITDVSVVYYYSAFNVDTQNNCMTLQPSWKVTYCKEINGKKLSDYILLDGTTGSLLTNET